MSEPTYSNTGVNTIKEEAALAVLAASNYVQKGSIRWLIGTAIACGAAAGMVGSGSTASLRQSLTA